MKYAGGKEWFSAAELAELGLPGLPTTKRKINEDWAPVWALRTGVHGEPLARPRAGRGGGLEYHFLVLPPAVRTELVKRGVTVVADIVPVAKIQKTGLWRWFDEQTEKTKAEARCRLEVIQKVERLERAGIPNSQAVFTVAAETGDGASTIRKWFGLIAGVKPADRLPCLAHHHSGGAQKMHVDDRVWQFVKSDYLRPEKPPFSACYRRAKKFAEENGLDIPGERTLRRKLEDEVDGRVVVATREGADAMKRVIPQQKRTVADLHAMEVVNIDGHTWDVKVQWPDGREGRPLMVAIQDVYSRMFLAWRIDESESALATRMVFADLFENWGIPTTAIMDNGRAFASKIMTGGAKNRYRFKIRDDEPTGVLTALGIEIVFTTPYHGQAKPIERAFRDLEGSIGKHPIFSGANTGNNPMNKPENYGERAIPIAVFEEWVNRGIAEHNSRVGRKTEMAKARGLSFEQVFAESYKVAQIGKASPEQMRMALLTAEDRMCDRHSGELTLEGNRYHADELYAWRGKRVLVRFDPDDLHSEVHVYSRDEQFICTAPVIEAVGFRDKAAARAMSAKRREVRQAIKAKIEAENLLDAAELAALADGPTAPSAPIAATVIRAVRHRGQTAAALKPVREVAEAPLSTPVIDRLGAALRVIDGGL